MSLRVMGCDRPIPLSARQARANFPCGLSQPAGRYRFGLESMLLAGWAASTPGRGSRQVADLGCGCGATLIALALADPDASTLGLDADPEAVRHAALNAEALALTNISFMQADFFGSPARILPAAWQRHADIALANPPWNTPGSGRLAAMPHRRSALVRTPGLLERFLFWAREMLAHKGSFCVALPSSELASFPTLARGYDFGLRQVMPVAPFAGQAASLAMLIFRKGCAQTPVIQPPLIVHARQNGQAAWSDQLLEFCPWIRSSRQT